MWKLNFAIGQKTKKFLMGGLWFMISSHITTQNIVF